jgi:flagellar basal body-associated protein FliL
MDNHYEKKEGKMMIPIWVYFVAAGIVVSAYMAVTTGREEKKVEQDSIEREGEIYMKRLEREKEDRKSAQQSAG